MAAARLPIPVSRFATPVRARALALAAAAFLIAACTGATSSGAPGTNPGAAASPTTVPATPSAAPAFPVTLQDDEGTDVTIPAEPKKIVSLTPATTETLFAIGAGSQVVGKVQDPANYPPEAASIPEVATFAGVDVEKIVALAPDLVVSGGTGLSQGDAVEQLRRAGIPVLVSYPTKLDQASDGIRQIGKAVGRSEAAETVAGAMDDRIDQLAAVAAGAEAQPRTFYEIDTTGGIFTPPADSIYGEMFTLAGGDPISGNASYSISLEDLVAADPQVILLGDAAYGVTAADVAKRSGWGGMTAVKDGRIVPIDDVIVTRPGPRLADGLEALIRAIHPELEVDGLLPSGSPVPLATAA